MEFTPHSAAVGRCLHLIRAAEAAEGKPSAADVPLEVRAPLLAEKIADDVVRRFRAHVAAAERADVFGRPRIGVRKIPVDDRLHRGVREPDAVEVAHDLGLHGLVAGIFRIRGDGELGDLQRPFELRVRVHDAEHVLGVVLEARLGRDPLHVRAPHRVRLDADPVDSASLHERVLDLHVVGAARGPVAVDHVGRRLVYHELVGRKVLRGRLEAPLDEVPLAEEHAVAVLGRSPEERLVRDLPHRNALRVACGKLGEALFKQRLLALHRAPRPRRLPVGVVQTVRLRLDVVRLAELEAEVYRGAAVDVGGVLRIARLAAFGLDGLPVERQGREVERRRETFAVRGGHLRAVFRLGEAEEVRAVLEVVSLLPHLHMDGFAGTALRVLEHERGVSFSVAFDSVLHARVRLLRSRAEVPQHGVPVVFHRRHERRRDAGARQHHRIAQKIPARRKCISHRLDSLDFRKARRQISCATPAARSMRIVPPCGRYLYYSTFDEVTEFVVYYSS